MKSAGLACICMFLCGCKMMARREANVPPRKALTVREAISSFDSQDRQTFKAINAFSEAMIRTLPTDKSTVCSPVGAFFSLSLLLNGAQGDTFEKLCKTLHMNDPSLEKLNATNSRILDLLAAYDVRMGASVWSVPPIKFSPRYTDDMARWYGAEVRRLGSAGENALGQLNDWSKAKTAGQYDQLFGTLSKNTDSLLLANVIQVSLPAATPDQNLYRLPTRSHFDGSGFIAYGGTFSESLAIWIVKPTGNGNLSSTQAAVANSISAWKTGLDNSKGVAVPNFAHRSNSDLTRTMEALGEKRILTGPNDFTALSHETKEGFYLSRFQQYAELEITPVSFETQQVPLPTIQAPFFYFVREENTGLILLAGVCKN